MHGERLPSLDLLRGAAAFGVAIPHMMLFALPGNVLLEAVASLGVEVFFVLSGYVLAPQIMRCFERPGDLPVFLQRRWIRTVPPYLLALVCVSLYSGQFGTDDFLRYALYLQNLLWQSNSMDYFSIAWSLSVEEWFYCIFPLVLIASRGLVSPNRRGAIHVALGFVAVVALYRTLLGNYDLWGEEVRRVVIFRIDAIAYGFLLYLLPHRLPRHLALASLLAAMTASAAILAAIIANESMLGKALFPVVAPLFGATTIMAFLSFDKAIETRSSLKWLSSWLGRISFSVYLFHQIIAMLMIDRFAMRYAIQIPASLIATIIFSLLMYRYFEKPLLDSRPRYRQPPVPLATAVSGGAAS